MNASQLVRRALSAGAIVTALIGMVAAVIGALLGELAGMLGALVGAGVGFALLGLTPVSIMWGFKLGKGDVLSPDSFRRCWEPGWSSLWSFWRPYFGWGIRPGWIPPFCLSRLWPRY